jgi:hypothetical protein
VIVIARHVVLLTLCTASVLCCVVYRVACVVEGGCDCVRAGNDIGDAGCESLSSVLRVNSTLMSLDVSGECDCDCATRVVVAVRGDGDGCVVHRVTCVVEGRCDCREIREPCPRGWLRVAMRRTACELDTDIAGCLR